MVTETAETFLTSNQNKKWDLVIEDTWVGAHKASWVDYLLEASMTVVSKKGFYAMNLLYEDAYKYKPRVKAMFKHVVHATTKGLNTNSYLIATNTPGYDAEVFKRNAARLLRPETLKELKASTLK